MAHLDVSFIIPVVEGAGDLSSFVRKVVSAAKCLGVSAEIIACGVADLRFADATTNVGATYVAAPARGYGAALTTGFAVARGTYFITLDPDLADPGECIKDLWSSRHVADIVVASRYITGGTAQLSLTRRLLSSTLNRVFSRGLSLHVRDMSSGLRLYKAEIFRDRQFVSTDLNILQEILVVAYAEGRSVGEIPVHYQSSRARGSALRIVQFGVAYIRTFWSLWKLRNSILCADYDSRAHDSPIPLQRYWQRQRFSHVVQLLKGCGPVLDVGCGSSRIIGALPAGSVGMDILQRKLRYAKRFGRHLVRASGFNIPFADASFPCVLCSQVIEHVPKASPIIDELCRVVAPNGRLVLGTPDYANWEWVVTEKLYGWFAPGGYADEHIAHYTREELIATLAEKGFRVEETRYILRGELILAFTKVGARSLHADPNAGTVPHGAVATT